VTQIGTAYLKVLLDTDQVQSGLKKTEGSIAKWGKGLAVAGAAGAGLGIAVNFLKQSVDAAKESEKVQKNLERTVTTTGQSYGKYAKQIENTITKTSNLAAVDDEDLAESFTKLQGSTKDVSKALEGMQLAADIAAARGISLEAATKAVEKSMTGQANAFKRVGVNLPKVTDAYDALKAQVTDLQDAQKGASASEKKALQTRIDTIKQSYEAAKASDKQKTSTNELAEAQKRFGGAAEDYGKTAAGAQERFGIALENVKEQVGTALLPLLARFFEMATKGLTAFQKHWPEIRDSIKRTYEVVRPTIEQLGKVIENIAEQVANVARLIKAIASGDWSAAWRAIKDIVREQIDLIVSVIKLSPITRILGEMIDKIKEVFSNAVDGVKRAAGKVADAIVDAIMLPVNFYVGLGTRIVDGIKAAGTWVVQHFGTPFAAVVALIREKVTAVLDFGADLGRKLLDGIKAGAQWLIDHLVNPFAGLADKLKEKLLDALDGIKDWLADKIRGLVPGPLRGVVGKVPGLGFVGQSAQAAGNVYAPAAVAGTVPAPTAGLRAGEGGGGMLGSGLGTRALSLPGLGQAVPTLAQAVPRIEVRVFIGDTELRGIVRTEVGRSDTGIARTLLAGGPV
jgi:hypothetical protein